MSVVRHDLRFDEGSIFRLAITWVDFEGNPHDLTGYGALLQVRQAKDPNSPVLLSAASPAYGEVTDGYITIIGPEGRIIVFFNSDVLEAKRNLFTKAFYDLKMFPSGFTVIQDNIRLTEGKATYTYEVTDQFNIPV